MPRKVKSKYLGDITERKFRNAILETITAARKHNRYKVSSLGNGIIPKEQELKYL